MEFKKRELSTEEDTQLRKNNRDVQLPPPNTLFENLDQQERIQYRAKKASHDNIMAKNNNSNRKESMINLLQEKISATPNLKKFPSLSNENHDEKHGNTSLEILAQNKQKQLMEVLRKRKNVNLQKISLT